MTRLSKNIFYNVFGQLALLIIGFLAIKNIYNELGEDFFGIYFFSELITTLVVIFFNKSIKLTIIREISSNMNTNKEYVNEIIQTYSFISWITFLLLSLVLFFCSPIIINKWINLTTINFATANRVFIILGISALSSVPSSYYNGVLAGAQRMEFGNIIDVATQCLKRFGVVIIISFGGNLDHVTNWTAVCCGLCVFFYALCSFYIVGIKNLIPVCSFKVLKRNIMFSSKILLAAIFSTIQRNIDKIIISKILNIVVVGYYGTIYSITSKSSMITGAISHALYPSISEIYKKGNNLAVMLKYKKMEDTIYVINAPIFSGIWFVSLPLLTFIFNKNIASLLIIPFFLLLFGFYLNVLITVPWIFSLVADKPEITTRSNFLSMIFSVPVSIIAVLYLTLDGAGLSWVMYNLFFYLFAIPKICKDCLYINLKEWYMRLLKVNILLLFPYIIIWSFLWYFNLNSSLVAVLLAYTLSSLIFLLLCYKINIINVEFQKMIFHHAK